MTYLSSIPRLKRQVLSDSLQEGIQSCDVSMFGIFWGTPTNMERWKNDHSWLNFLLIKGAEARTHSRVDLSIHTQTQLRLLLPGSAGAILPGVMETWGHRPQDRMPECNFVNVNSVVGILDPQFLLGYRVPNPKCSNGILHWILWSKKLSHTDPSQKPVRVAPDRHTRTMPIPRTPCPMSLSGEDSPGPTGITNVIYSYLWGQNLSDLDSGSCFNVSAVHWFRVGLIIVCPFHNHCEVTTRNLQWIDVK